MKTHYALLFIICCLTVYSHAQTEARADTQVLINEYAQKYTESAKDFAVIFNGLDQPKLIKNIKSAYLRKKGYKEYDGWESETYNLESLANGAFDEGQLLYDGVLYSKISMRLDLYTNELMVLTPNITYRVVLDPGRVEYADFNGYHVIYISPDSEIKLQEGYYQQLYAGKSSVLRKESFSLDRQAGRLANWSKRYYICKDGISYRVKNKKAVLKVFKSHKKELERYIKDMNIDFKNIESALPVIVEQYDKLTEK